ncbi:MAG TPA: asparaginase [Rhizomicrobium sp.]|nr:asparaginase [Rhizomicrobium sp.]
MANPVLVEITRGDLVESIHRGSIAIADAKGNIRFALGDLTSPVYPRSSLKPIQALPLLESGAAEAFGLSDEEIALACASHSSEPMHTTRVAAWLSRIGCVESDLACGAHPSRYEPVAEDMIRRGEKPTRIHNNCSGKHSGFLTVARHWDIATEGYEKHDHPVQRAIAKALGELTDIEGELPWGVDGCAAPNFAVPLDAQARAFAKFAAPDALSPARAQACRRIVRAMMANPELVSGTGRACAILMRSANGRVAVKTGAEGFFIAMIPELALGVALKIDDGASRAAETAIAAVLDKLGVLGDGKEAREMLHAPIENTRKEVVGQRRAAPALKQATISL